MMLTWSCLSLNFHIHNKGEQIDRMTYMHKLKTFLIKGYSQYHNNEFTFEKQYKPNRYIKICIHTIYMYIIIYEELKYSCMQGVLEIMMKPLVHNHRLISSFWMLLHTSLVIYPQNKKNFTENTHKMNYTKKRQILI